MSSLPAAATRFLGGRVCLDFANTVDWRTSDAPEELVADYPALLAWSARRGTMAAFTAARLRAAAARRPRAAARALREARVVRAEIWTLAEALHRGAAVELGPVNRRLAGLPPQPRLRREGRRYVHELPGARLGEALWPVLWSLSALLSSDDAARVGRCRAEGCGWFFVDESPNGSRTWCSSEGCGNRERARRAYAKRTRPARATPKPRRGHGSSP